MTLHSKFYLANPEGALVAWTGIRYHQEFQWDKVKKKRPWYILPLCLVLWM